MKLNLLFFSFLSIIALLLNGCSPAIEKWAEYDFKKKVQASMPAEEPNLKNLEPYVGEDVTSRFYYKVLCDYVNKFKSFKGQQETEAEAIKKINNFKAQKDKWIKNFIKVTSYAEKEAEKSYENVLNYMIKNRSVNTTELAPGSIKGGWSVTDIDTNNSFLYIIQFHYPAGLIEECEKMQDEIFDLLKKFLSHDTGWVFTKVSRKELQDSYIIRYGWHTGGETLDINSLDISLSSGEGSMMVMITLNEVK